MSIFSKIKKKYRKYYDPIGSAAHDYEKEAHEQARAQEAALKAAAEAQAAQEKYQTEQLRIAEESAALAESQMQWEREQYEKQLAEAEAEKVAAEEEEARIAAEEEARMKSRNLRRTALIKTTQQGVLGEATVGRRKLLAS